MQGSRKAPVQASNDSCVIQIQVAPRSSRIAIEALGVLHFKVRLTAPPVEGSANRQLIEVLSDHLSLPRRQIEIVSGENSRHKRVAVHGATGEAIQRLLSS